MEPRFHPLYEAQKNTYDEWGYRFFRDKTLRDGEDTYMKLRQAKYDVAHLDTPQEPAPRSKAQEPGEEDEEMATLNRYYKTPRVGSYHRYNWDKAAPKERHPHDNFVPVHLQSERRIKKVNEEAKKILDEVDNTSHLLKHSTAHLNSWMSRADVILDEIKKEEKDVITNRLFHDIAYDKKTGRKKAIPLDTNETAVQTFERIFPPELCGHYSWAGRKTYTQDTKALDRELKGKVSQFYRSSKTGRDLRIQKRNASRSVPNAVPLTRVDDALPDVKDLPFDPLTKQVVRVVQRQGQARRDLLFQQNHLIYRPGGKKTARPMPNAGRSKTGT